MGRWVIIAAERGRRPIDFSLREKETLPLSGTCPFCQGNEAMTPPEIVAYRKIGKANSPGWLVRVVPSRNPVLRIEGELGRRAVGIYDMMNGVGAHEVIIETPEHQPHLDELEISQLGKIFRIYRDRILDLKKDRRFKYLLIFKNYGSRAGASTISHLHSQLIATPVTPKRVKSELIGAKRYFDYKKRCIYCDILRQEVELGKRTILENKGFLAWAPFAARFPFEVWIIPKRHSPDYETISDEEINDLGRLMKDLMGRLRQGLSDPPYNYILHTGPNRIPRRGYWSTIDDDFHWHLEIMPRLTRLGGFEWGSGFYINLTPPEDVAKFFRESLKDV